MQSKEIELESPASVPFEFWDAGGNDCYVYTRSHSIARELRRDFCREAVYAKGIRATAWQFKVPKRMIKFLLTRFGVAKGTSTQNMHL